jgi:hypothetical protein
MVEVMKERWIEKLKWSPRLLLCTDGRSRTNEQTHGLLLLLMNTTQQLTVSLLLKHTHKLSMDSKLKHTHNLKIQSNKKHKEKLNLP